MDDDRAAAAFSIASAARPRGPAEKEAKGRLEFGPIESVARVEQLPRFGPKGPEKKFPAHLAENRAHETCRHGEQGRPPQHARAIPLLRAYGQGGGLSRPGFSIVDC